MHRQYGYYLRKISLTFFALSLWICVFFSLTSTLLLVLMAIPLAFIFVQLTGLGHDAAHNQIAKSTQLNAILGILHIGLMGGASFSWWRDKHNAHHLDPNVEDADPDIDFPMIAFSRNQAIQKRGIFRFIVRHQTKFYLFLVSLVPFNMRFHSLRIIFTKKSSYPLLELASMLLHFVWLFSLIFSRLPLAYGILFFLISQMFTGLHLAAIFAPNHKGMPILPKNNQLTFMQKQVFTSRDVYAHPITDFFYLGLNYQIEHHLFTNMPRCNLKKAQIITKDFCKKYQLPYHETTIWESYQEVYKQLSDASLALAS